MQSSEEACLTSLVQTSGIIRVILITIQNIRLEIVVHTLDAIYSLVDHLQAAVTTSKAGTTELDYSSILGNSTKKGNPNFRFCYRGKFLVPAFSFAFYGILDGDVIYVAPPHRESLVNSENRLMQKANSWRVDESRPIQISTDPSIPKAKKSQIFHYLVNRITPNRARVIAKIADNRINMQERRNHQYLKMCARFQESSQAGGYEFNQASHESVHEEPNSLASKLELNGHSNFHSNYSSENVIKNGDGQSAQPVKSDTLIIESTEPGQSELPVFWKEEGEKHDIVMKSVVIVALSPPVQ
ncbi:hypothetical protein TRFO_03019 [Tritrichomonas foetus]|uniref:Uncharacterized protein n=1 Tax=Tritrichomonas foetus TaxID=1144522 RepID=A0A1J4KU04_9EUKA|nr:hypothetical protein TRFO_03019 [Tritrichomonas foetus]|eukprot:OHT14747.1 hypothetical protein TRFO_03019 [Tritrichomonas foetus]